MGEAARNEWLLLVSPARTKTGIFGSSTYKPHCMKSPTCCLESPPGCRTSILRPYCIKGLDHCLGSEGLRFRDKGDTWWRLLGMTNSCILHAHTPASLLPLCTFDEGLLRARSGVSGQGHRGKLELVPQEACGHSDYCNVQGVSKKTMKNVISKTTWPGG